MIQGRSGLNLSVEVGQRLKVAGGVFWQELERDETMQPSVLGLLDYAGFASVEFSDDAIVRDGLFDRSIMSDQGRASYRSPLACSIQASIPTRTAREMWIRNGISVDTTGFWVVRQ